MYKGYYEYKDIEKATGKSHSSVKKWRLKVEEISGYTFKSEKVRVTPRFSKVLYMFTKREYEKFIQLSKMLDETKNMKESIAEIWGDQKTAKEKALYEDVADLKERCDNLEKDASTIAVRLYTIGQSINYLKKLEERIKTLEENQNRGFFSRKKK